MQNCENRILASSYLSVCLSVRMEKLGSHWTDLDVIWYLQDFRKSVGKIKVSLKPDNNNGYIILRPMYIYDNMSLNSSYNKKYFRQQL
jgi:hypothetical protein